MIYAIVCFSVFCSGLFLGAALESIRTRRGWTPTGPDCTCRHPKNYHHPDQAHQCVLGHCPCMGYVSAVAVTTDRELLELRKMGGLR